jgi:glycerol-3-phosphate acyltransferase PlsY
VTATAVTAVVAAYLVGGIPIGLLVARAKGIRDIREHGSGNIGATNVQRVLGTKLGLLVWVADLLKGLAPVLLGRHVVGLEGAALVTMGLATALGHCFSPFLGFAGGRAVSTSLGVMLGLYWLAGVVALLLFVVVVARTRYISLGSVLGGLSAAPLMLLLLPMHPSYAVGCLALGLLITLRHLPNIKRLLAGTERRLGQKVAEAPGEGGGPDVG